MLYCNQVPSFFLVRTKVMAYFFSILDFFETKILFIKSFYNFSVQSMYLCTYFICILLLYALSVHRTSSRLLPDEAVCGILPVEESPLCVAPSIQGCLRCMPTALIVSNWYAGGPVRNMRVQNNVPVLATYVLIAQVLGASLLLVFAIHLRGKKSTMGLCDR